MKNSSRLELKMARNLTRSRSGTVGSLASFNTRRLNSSHARSRSISRFCSLRNNITKIQFNLSLLLNNGCGVNSARLPARASKKEIAGDADRITFHHLDPVREAR